MIYLLPLSTLLLGELILAVIVPTFINPYQDPAIWISQIDNPNQDELAGLVDTLDEPADSSNNQIDIATVTPTLMVLNILLIWFHIVDLTTIISSDLSNAAVLSQNVHVLKSVTGNVSTIGILHSIKR